MKFESHLFYLEIPQKVPFSKRAGERTHPCSTLFVTGRGQIIHHHQ